MKKLWDVAVVGEIFADHVFSGFERWPQPGEEVLTEQYVREVGGGVAITACALAKLGRKAAAFCVVGREDAWIGARLEGFGVSLDGFKYADGPTAVTVSLSTKEDRSFFTYPGANKHLASYLQSPELQMDLSQARHVHFAMPLDPAPGVILLAKLKAAGCTLSLDAGYQPEWLANQATWELCRHIDYFLPNESEGRLMTGWSGPEGMLSAFAAGGLRNTVLKLGPKGAAALIENEVCCAASPQIEVVDTTGAGDAFDAGLIDALLDHLPLQQAMERGCICGAFSTRAAGALNALPGREELNVPQRK